MTDPFARFGEFVYRRRWVILAAWLVAIGVCGAFAPKAADVLKAGGIEVPDSDSAVASKVLADEFNISALNNVAVVFHSDSLKVGDKAFRSQVEAADPRVSRADGVTRVVSFYDTGLPTLVSKDRHTTIMFASLKGDEGEAQTHVEGVRDALDGVKIEHYVTGPAAVNHDFQTTSEDDLKRAEVFTFALVLLLLLLTFRTVVSAVVPLILGIAAVVTATAVIYVIGRETDTSLFALNVASMIGLGLAIDFSLIVVSRFREELAARGDPRQATAATMATAGRSIVYSGVTVLLGMLVLTLLVDLMVIRSISLGVMLVAATALLAGVTLLPAVLGVLAHRVERLRVIPKGRPKPESEGFWYRFSRAVMRRPWAWLAGSLAILLVLALPVRELKMLGATSKLLPAKAESVKGTDILDAEFGENLLSPIQIILKTPEKDGVFTPRFLTGLDRLTNTLAADPRAKQVTSLATYMAAEPRYDGRWKHITAEHDFTPRPAMNDLASNEIAPGVFLKEYINAWVDNVPYSPAYFGFGQFQFSSGATHELQVTPTLQVYRVNRGNLTVQAGRPVTLWRKADFGKRHKGKTIAAGSTITLVTGDQLVVRPETPVTLRVEGEPVEMIAAVGFHVRPGITEQDSWLGGEPTSDPFEGIPRTVIGGGLGMTFPNGETNIKLDLARTRPHAWFPRHLHPGPELIVVKSGTLTIFSSPDLVVALPRRKPARLHADRHPRARQGVRQPRRRQRRDRAQRRPALRALRRPAGGFRHRHSEADRSEHSRPERGSGVRRRHDGQLHGLPARAVRPLPLPRRRRAAAHVLDPDDVLPVGLPAAEGDPDEHRLDPRDLRRARPDLPARLGLGPRRLRIGGRDRGDHARDPVRDPVQPLDRLRSVHALADQGVLPPDSRQRGVGGRGPAAHRRHHHGGGPDPDRSLRLVRHRRHRHDQGDRPGPGDRRPDRHGHRAHDHGPRDDAPGRRHQLVDARLAQADRARAARGADRRDRALGGRRGRRRQARHRREADARVAGRAGRGINPWPGELLPRRSRARTGRVSAGTTRIARRGSSSPRARGRPGRASRPPQRRRRARTRSP